MWAFLDHPVIIGMLNDLENGVRQYLRELRVVGVNYLVLCWHRNDDIVFVTVGIVAEPALLMNALWYDEFDC